MTALRFPIMLLLMTLFSLGGCTRHQPVPLYQLDSGAIGVPAAEQGIAVLLGPVAIADYLQRDALLQRQADGSLTPAEDGRWAGSLAADLDQQLVRQLAARLDSQRLVLAPASAGFVPQVRVGLSITRLDSGPLRPAVLEAQWRVAGADGKLVDGRLVRLEEAHNGSLVDQVRAQSSVVQQLVKQMAQAVQTYHVSVTAAKPAPARKPKRVNPSAPVGPRIPVAEPIRGDAEVFRF